ncbi:MAG: glycosyltransferase family 39 protein, partial [Bacteroidota bacterium]
MFLFYWTKLFGLSEQYVKLPFIFMGVTSIFIVYKIALKRFSETAAIFSSLFLACSQFMIIYSQYARPYISGSFLVLLLFYFLLRVLFDENVKRYNWLALGIFFFLSAINHHVCMLTAFVAALTGLIFLKKERITAYLIICVASAFLYLVHLPITLNQLSIGGVGGWLSAPESGFIIQVLVLGVHESPLLRFRV